MKLQNWLFEELDGAKDFAKNEANKRQDWLFIYMFTPDPIFPLQNGKNWIVQTYESLHMKKRVTPVLVIRPDSDFAALQGK